MTLPNNPAAGAAAVAEGIAVPVRPGHVRIILPGHHVGITEPVRLLAIAAIVRVGKSQPLIVIATRPGALSQVEAATFRRIAPQRSVDGIMNMSLERQNMICAAAVCRVILQAWA